MKKEKWTGFQYHKTFENARNRIEYEFCNGERTIVNVVKRREDGTEERLIPEELLKEFYRMEDNEVYNNLKHRKNPGMTKAAREQAEHDEKKPGALPSKEKYMVSFDNHAVDVDGRDLSDALCNDYASYHAQDDEDAFTLLAAKLYVDKNLREDLKRIYHLIMDDHMMQKEIAEKMEISESTVTRRVKELEDILADQFQGK